MTALEFKASSPRVSTVNVFSIERPSLRLDAKHYQEEFVLARSRVAHCVSSPLRELADAFVPGRMKLVSAQNSEAGAPYLRAHDAFEARPTSKRYAVRARTDNYDDYLLKEGMLLTPSSGRNLGPMAYVGKKLSRFAMTDILRIVPQDKDAGYYLFAYLLTPTGQALIRRGRTGTMVDHLSPEDVLQIPVVQLPEKERKRVIAAIRKAEEKLDKARLSLDELDLELHRLTGLGPMLPKGKYLKKTGARVFSINSRDLTLRLDAAYYEPAVRSAQMVLKSRGARRLDELAELRLLGRYKRYYVAKEFGRPILSGRHLLQLRQVNLQYISDRSFKLPESFILKRGWCVFTCDGRAEEQLGSPAYVHARWDGWMASNHVMRAIPLPGIEPGYLYLALRNSYVQLQLKARATGSVIDALEPETIADVLLPSVSVADQKRLGKAASRAWDDIAMAQELEERTVAEFEAAIGAGSTVPLI